MSSHTNEFSADLRLGPREPGIQQVSRRKSDARRPSARSDRALL